MTSYCFIFDKQNDLRNVKLRGVGEQESRKFGIRQTRVEIRGMNFWSVYALALACPSLCHLTPQRIAIK